jgi:hypothetical protein
MTISPAGLFINEEDKKNQSSKNKKGVAKATPEADFMK